ncbi:hypothetical protein I2483_18730 [Sporosarcina sp. E16_3]|uniref:hypothetical protein n=1 Tax=Sporosarcina sp. E16_3 TaxID=2789293 RepID=UPI001A930273|nr:hypothetical protein [Sporosarcina sp. E16_3]MBO0603702.1 hypothetical protein [Sporosarcina sp. E16_3]
MTKRLVDKAKSILEGIEIGFFDTAKNWDVDNYDEYYKYFSHPDFEVRKYSLLVFAAGLGNWYGGSAIIFRPIEERKKEKWFLSYKEKIYYFEDYVRSFIDNREAIKKEFPFLYSVIVSFLIQLDNEKRFEYIFSPVDKQLFIVLRQLLSGLEVKHQYNFNDLLREVGLPTFFEN